MPEAIARPFDFIRSERLRILDSGIGDKRILGQKMLYSGFSIEAAATHPNCHSAKYFLEKLKSLSRV